MGKQALHLGLLVRIQEVTSRSRREVAGCTTGSTRHFSTQHTCDGLLCLYLVSDVSLLAMTPQRVLWRITQMQYLGLRACAERRVANVSIDREERFYS
jgi:hypothetical protein